LPQKKSQRRPGFFLGRGVVGVDAIGSRLRAVRRRQGSRVCAVEHQLTHVDERGAARMVDVSAKDVTLREATAECFVRMAPATIDAIRSDSLKKGDALQVARVAAIMATKRTPELIPLCHPLSISGVDVRLDVGDDGVRVEVTVRVTGTTGVEMEALTAAAVAGLTLIDMVKSLERGVVIERVQLLHKVGGRSGEWKR
jgi:cyclic pyranopterin phosphate synthase